MNNSFWMTDGTYDQLCDISVGSSPATVSWADNYRSQIIGQFTVASRTEAPDATLLFGSILVNGYKTPMNVCVRLLTSRKVALQVL